METYEQKYNIALDWARKVYPHTCGKEKEDLERVFPDLKESEDERIRKLLVWQVHRNIEDETNDLAQSVYDGIKGHDPDLEESIEDWKRCLAYLEKQKEQKPAEYPEKGNEYWFGFNEGEGTVLDNPEQFGLYKPAEWSKEDEHYFQNLIMAVDSTFGDGNTKNWLQNRLKSLRPRPHCKSENIIELFRPAPGTVIEKGIKEAIEKATQSGNRIVFEFNNWLKIIEPGNSKEDLLNEWYKREPHWKPSEKQMEALNEIIHEVPMSLQLKDKLIHLEDDLQKLL